MSEPWDSLITLSDAYTCYSSALATWTAWADEDWAMTVNPGLWLTVTEAGDGLFGFGHFPPRLRHVLGLRRVSTTTAEAAVNGVLAEVSRSGRVIVAGDGFNLPWHVASARVHVPHWFVIVAASTGPTVLDPFACRNELGNQTPTTHAVERDALAALLAGLPGDDRVLALREALALGDDAGEPEAAPYQWYVHDAVPEVREPQGVHGPDAILRLAEYFRARAQEPAAYAQADDIWSIARHRAFLAAVLAREAQARGDADLATWIDEHVVPLAKRWAHMAPLLMQARLAVGAGRPASSSVADRLEELAGRERAAGESAGSFGIASLSIGSSSI